MTTNNITSLLVDNRLPISVSRCGLTLTEILASVFVLSFGLVAALTVLPFATFQLNRMNVADTSGACGRGTIQQIRMAEWQKPEALNYAWDVFAPADPYIVDPLGLFGFCDNPIAASIVHPPKFPYHLNLDTSTVGLHVFVPVEIASQSSVVERDYVSNLYFRWGDDVLFDASDSSQRPTKVESAVTSAGDFTWMYMVTPVIDPQATVWPSGTSVPPSGTIFPSAVTSPEAVLGYEVASVVFHRRDMVFDTNYPAIRQITLDNTKSTINATGACIELSSSDPDEMDLSTIKWLLLTSTPIDMPITAQWYRITGYDDMMPNGDGYVRRVFLVGPDWKGAKNAAGNPDGTVHAILCDGVVNVFQATMPK